MSSRVATHFLPASNNVKSQLPTQEKMLKFRFKPFNSRWLKKRSTDTSEKSEMSVSRIKRSSSCPKLDPSLTRVTVVKGSEDYTAEGTTIKVVCAEGFRLSSSRSKFRCKGGLWRPGLPHCLPRDCPRPAVPHAEVTRANQTVTVTCHSGYRMTGAPRLTCRRGSWEPHLPVCLGVPCHLPQIDHGEYLRYRSESCLRQDKTSHSISPNIQYICKLKINIKCSFIKRFIFSYKGRNVADK